MFLEKIRKTTVNLSNDSQKSVLKLNQIFSKTNIRSSSQTCVTSSAYVL
jgi:hypothetical protein